MRRAPKTARPIPKRTSPAFLPWYKHAIPSDWQTPAHVVQIADALDKVTAGQIDRLAISMPPRHGKSETVAIRYPVYRLLRSPCAVLATGYNERFARRFGRKTRLLAQRAGVLDTAKQAADEWHTTNGGLFMARGVGSPPTGIGFDLIIVDDPIRSRKDADSLAYRDRAWDWFSEDLLSRLEPGAAIVMVGTRWHHDDVLARAVASEPELWTVINLPALDDTGTALWPERYPVEALERIKAVNPPAFESLYQGRPTPREGALFQPDRITWLDTAPDMVSEVRAWDMAASSEGDWTAGVRMGKTSDGWHISHVERFRAEPGERNRRIRLVAERDGPQVRIRGPVDPGSAGVEAGQAFTRNLAGFAVTVHRVTGDKRLRAEPLAAQVNQGRVTATAAPWAAAFTDELRLFPAGRHDDQVDAAADAFAALEQGNKVFDFL